MDARQEYQTQLSAAERTAQEIEKQLATLVWVRTVLFFLSAGCLIFGYFGEVARAINVPLGWLFGAGFLVVIVWNEHRRLAHLSALNDVALFKRLIARLDRRWQELTAVEFLPDAPDLACSDDLDVAGDHGLMALMNLTGTYPGLKQLQDWIAVTPTWPQVKQRQSATRALVPMRDFRLELIRRIANTNFATKMPYGLAEWAAKPSWLQQHRFAHGISYLFPAVLIVGAIIMLIGQQRDDQMWMRVGLGCLATGAIANILITMLWGSWIHDIFQRVCGEHHASSQFAEIFKMMEKLPVDGGILSDSKRIMIQQPDSAVRGFADLNRLVRLASLQRNVVFYLIYLVVQLVILWDFRILKMLEKWQRRYGTSAGQWFESLGRCEAILCAATLADEHPDWCYPVELSDRKVRFQARQLGHPLLPTNVRVSNDLTLAADRPLLLVTGSNMAGKSTFMRAVGVNLLLARTGCTVCASQFASDMVDIASSIRVRDSLREGVSFFMAELRRLKSVVDMAVKHQAGDHPPLLFLLDEILQGTNSRERQIAVAHVVGELVKHGTIGLLSTHDLDLAKVDEVSAVAQIVHFREYFETDAKGQQIMRFDYIMRPGPTPTTNALKLLELVGLK